MLRSLRSLIARLRSHRRGRLLFGGAGMLVVLALVAACDSTNTYPIDYFAEMHYQPMYRSVEPPRFDSPDGTVPVQGREPLYSRQELAAIDSNPLEATPDVLEHGADLFNTNCAACHGEDAQGDGPVAVYFEQAIGRSPANLLDERLIGSTDGYLASVITYGLGDYMPAFGNLLPREDQWAIILHIRDLEQQAQSASQ